MQDSWKIFLILHKFTTVEIFHTPCPDSVVLSHSPGFETGTIASSIPHGSDSVLSCFYIDDLLDVVKKCVTIFADETKEQAVIQPHLNVSEVQDDLYSMSDWSEI